MFVVALYQYNMDFYQLTEFKDVHMCVSETNHTSKPSCKKSCDERVASSAGTFLPRPTLYSVYKKGDQEWKVHTVIAIIQHQQQQGLAEDWLV